ncbi:MAG: ABC transporter permease [Planctomycetota bacterium]|jgi:putative ABC transport system permease protein
MKGLLYLAWRYLAYHWFKTGILIASITLILFLPSGLRVLVKQSQQQLTARAESTPLLIGSKGSPLELVLNAVYFSSKVPEFMPYAEVGRVAKTGLAHPIPLYVRFHAQDNPIVGTNLDYFEFRNLRIQAGRQMARLGDCVVGAELAKRRGILPGHTIISSPEKVFDFAGVYPLKMHVAGILEFSDSPDDDAIFVDTKTAWVIEGLAHGHEDLARPEAASRVLKRDGNVVVGNASVVQYNEITDENINSFHFHGDPASFHITSVIAVPHDHKTQTLLLGRYKTDEDTPYQILKPHTVLNELLSTILTIERFVVTALLVVGISTLVIAALVFMLSLRLRRREIETMTKIGGSKIIVNLVLVSEIVSVLLASVVLAAGLTVITGCYAADVIRTFL